MQGTIIATHRPLGFIIAQMQRGEVSHAPGPKSARRADPLHSISGKVDLLGEQFDDLMGC